MRRKREGRDETTHGERKRMSDAPIVQRTFPSRKACIGSAAHINGSSILSTNHQFRTHAHEERPTTRDDSRLRISKDSATSLGIRRRYAHVKMPLRRS